MTRRGRVLLAGSTDRATLAAARSLGCGGLSVEVVRFSSFACGEWSRYVTRVHDAGSPEEDAAACLERFAQVVAKGCYDLVIPMNDTACELCSAGRQDLLTYSRIAQPEDDVYRYSQDKLACLELARQVGVPVPRFVPIERLEQLGELTTCGLEPPLYLKPTHSARLVGNRIPTFSVQRARSWDEVFDFCRLHLLRTPVLVQEECPGRGVGLYLLAEEGRILTMMQQNRLHEPLGGGGSSYRISAAVVPELATAAERLIAAIGWTGVAMVELRRSTESGEWWLMELNGRFWGSLALTISAGLNLPLWLYHLYTGSGSRQWLAGVTPRIGVRQRHLKKDLGWLLRAVRHRRRSLGTLVHWVASLRHLLSGVEHLDVESLADPLPALADHSQVAARGLGRAWRLAGRLLAGWRYRLQETALCRSAAMVLAEKTPRILFVCRGNIGRSAFAAALCRQRYGMTTVSSAGTLRQEGRLVPVVCAEVAAQEHGVNLADHRSTVLSPELLSGHDLVFVMDVANLVQVRQLGTSPAPVVLLGSMNGTGEIPDPYRRDREQVSRIFAQIAAALDSVGRVRHGR